MSTFELIIFILLILINTFLLLMWLVKKREYKHGKLFNVSEVVTLYALPKIVFTLYLIFLIFYLAGFNKLHLLYICPIVYFVITYKMAKRVIREDKERLLKKK